MEQHAKKKLIEILRKTHKAFTVNESGLRVSTEYPYIAASPDLEGSCNCCGGIVVEIKCPSILILCVKHYQPQRIYHILLKKIRRYTLKTHTNSRTTSPHKYNLCMVLCIYPSVRHFTSIWGFKPRSGNTPDLG